MAGFWDFIGKQLARLRFGVAYIQMIYYASVILGAIVFIGAAMSLVLTFLTFLTGTPA